jgi:L-methionine (R)-S-oxide reductase
VLIVIEYNAAEKDIQMILKEKGQQGFQDIVEYLHDNFPQYTWVGIYLVKGDMLCLGPWKGPQPTEHVTIPIGQGICGSAAHTGNTEIIDDVHKDERYLSCFISTRSEIVVPIKRAGNVIGEIDIDSDTSKAFTREDKVFLERISDMLQLHIRNL